MSNNIVRVRLNIDEFPENALSAINGLPARVWPGTKISFQIALVKGVRGSERFLTPEELSIYTDVTLGIFDRSRTGAAFAEKTIAAVDIDPTVNEESWNDGTKQHFQFEFSAPEMELPVDPGSLRKTYWWVVTANNEEYTFGGGDLVVIRDRPSQNGIVQAGNLVPADAEYDGNGEYELAGILQDGVYKWTAGDNDISVTNGGQSIIQSGTIFDAAGTTLILTGTPGEPVTAVVRKNPVIPAEVADARYFRGYKGSQQIENGAETVEVDDLGLTFVPSMVICTVRKPDANSLNLFATVRDGSITTAGFTADLNGETDSGDYYLDYLIL